MKPVYATYRVVQLPRAATICLPTFADLHHRHLAFREGERMSDGVLGPGGRFLGPVTRPQKALDEHN